MTSRRASDAWRLSVGTLTRIPVPPPRRVDPATAGRAMLLAPLVGILLALPALAVLLVVRALDASSLLAAALAVALLAWTTRALHLDGLADVADGLGSGTDPARARAAMKDPSVGAFGVVTVVLTLTVQVTALASASEVSAFALVTAVVVGRLTLVWACLDGVPAATPTGLGRAVAGTVARVPAIAVTVGVLALVAAGWAATAGLTPTLAAWPGTLVWPGVALLGLGACAVLLRVAVRRVGGVTGDVLGACVEVATTTVLVASALVAEAVVTAAVTT